MKKSILLLCAFVLVLSANAIPQSRVLHSLNDARDIRVERDHGRQRAKHFKGIQQKNNVLKAPKAQKETYVVNVGSVDYDVESSYDYEADAYLPAVNYKIFNADSSKVFKFYILLEAGMTDVESGKTYTFDDMSQWYCYWENPNSPMESGDFTDATFTKTVAADGSYTLVASATDDNGDIYNINYAGQPYVPQVIDVTIGVIYSSYYAETHEAYYQLLDADNQYAFYFDIYIDEGLTDVESGKTYTIADMSSYRTYGYRYVDYKNLDFASASFVKTVAADGSFTITASVTTPKGDTYNLSYSQGAPTIREESLTLDGFFMQDEYSWLLNAADEDTTVFVSLVVYDAFTEGTYTEAELDSYYTFVILLGADTTYYNLVEASIAVAPAGDSIYTAVGTMLVANEKDPTDQVLYTLNITAREVAVDPVSDYDDIYPKEADEDLNQTFAIYDVDDTYLEQYGSVYVEAINEDLYYIVLDIMLPEGATELAAGEYDINYTYGYQTVYSGYYSILYGEVVPSLAASLIEEDGKLYYDKIWWIVSGTVTIDDNLTITVDALNSLGRAINVVLNPGAEAIENVHGETVATKRIENGRLVIERAGRRYNALGTHIE